MLKTLPKNKSIASEELLRCPLVERLWSKTNPDTLRSGVLGARKQFSQNLPILLGRDSGGSKTKLMRKGQFLV